MPSSKKEYNFTIPATKNRDEVISCLRNHGFVTTNGGYSRDKNNNKVLNLTGTFQGKDIDINQIQLDLVNLIGPINRFFGVNEEEKHLTEQCLKNAGFTITGVREEAPGKFNIWFKLDEGLKEFEEKLSVALDCIREAYPD
ncbi:MAG: hypothetical protein KQH53_18805 [Desulfarculaceae bacterium]|nr:hypothetical protein [Desulfarculaceae bacterium]